MRKTKIIATLGPATDSPEMIAQPIAGGVNIFRLNMSHAPHPWVRRVVDLIRSSAKTAATPIGILMDTQGPAIRTGDLPVPLDLHPGQKFSLTVRGQQREEEHSVDVNYENFVNDIAVGDVVLIDNGEIHMKVLAKHDNKVECEVLTPGKLGSRRHINLPGVRVSLPCLTEKDKADVELAIELSLDLVALSFVREAQDILELRKLFQHVHHKPPIIAKIEDQTAIANLEAIILEADAVMVARGDLGIELPYEDLPIIQRKIVKDCLRIGRPVIVATHMLESMIENPLPTRAEITDVANAVFEQADAIMLSGETTVGQYPLRCIEVFDRISKRIERSGGANYHDDAHFTSPRQKLVKSAVVMADQLKADALLVFTIRGHMARHVAWLRPHYSPIYALCDQPDVANQLTLLRAVTPIVIPFNYQAPQETVDTAIRTLLKNGLLKKDNTVVVITAEDAGDRVVHSVQMRLLN